MITRLILAAFVCSSSYVHQGNDELIQWNSSRRLSWNDFKAIPPKNAPNAALTSSGIFIKFSFDGHTLSYEISCNFDKNSSWGRVKNDYILSHEQGHFDIAEIYARKLNQALKAYRLRENSIGKDVNAIYQRITQELQQTQNQYDNETDYSRNFSQQKIWLKKIERELDSLPEYVKRET